MKTILSPSAATSSSLLWLSDLHLDRASDHDVDRFLQEVSESTADGIVITGDISSAKFLIKHLKELASAVAPKPILFVTGNHDYYGGTLENVDAALRRLCAKSTNLHFLDGEQIVPIGRHTCVIGHRGWADARTGKGKFSRLHNPDHRAIDDLRSLTREEMFTRMRALGAESAEQIRNILPLALSRYRHVVILTHVPPYPEAVLYDGNECSPSHLPHYTNLSVGLAIRGIARAFPKRKITVLAGHSHSASVAHITPNLCVRVAHARTGKPGTAEVLRFS